MVRGHQPLPLGLREGDVVAGKYRIGSVIGAGAMGTVVAARHVLLEEQVAIKFLRPEALGHAEAVPRFLREARASVRIKSDHVVRVFDVDVFGEPKAPYIVMEYLDGCDLAERLEQHGPLPMRQAVDFVLQACEAIAEAHRLGIIHRDIKPANLFQVRRADRDDFIKVVDFGISKLNELTATAAGVGEGDAGRLITADRVMMGSPVYMSPEQMESARDVDERTDVWALGVTLCELLTNRLPFAGQSLVHVYFNIASDKPLRLPEWSPDWPAGLEAAILKCLERDRTKRFRSVNELAQAIAAFGPQSSSAYLHRMKTGVPVALGLAETVGPTASAAPVGGQTLPSAAHAEPSVKPRPTHRASWLVGVFIVIPILAYLLGTSGDRSGPSRSSAAPTPMAAAPSASLSGSVSTPEVVQLDPPAARTTLVTTTPSATASAEATTNVAPGPTQTVPLRADADARPKRTVATATAAAPSVSAAVTAPRAETSGASTAPPATPVPAPTSSASLLDRMLQRQE
jgi:serine/threonine protein kinase